jgi:hypothetical protein
MEDILQSQIIFIISSSVPYLTNPLIRKKLHQLGLVCTKYEINTKLHQMRENGLLGSYNQNGYHYWYLKCPTHFDIYYPPTTTTTTRDGGGGAIQFTKKTCPTGVGDMISNITNQAFNVDHNYQMKLKEVRNLAMNWKNANTTNVLPLRSNKITNFIRNSLAPNLGDETLRQITFDIITYGW